MRFYAVALINHLDDSGLQLKVVAATNWWCDALKAAFPGYLENLDSTLALEDAKTAAVQQDWEFDVVEVPQ